MQTPRTPVRANARSPGHVTTLCTQCRLRAMRTQGSATFRSARMGTGWLRYVMTARFEYGTYRVKWRRLALYKMRRSWPLLGCRMIWVLFRWDGMELSASGRVRCVLALKLLKSLIDVLLEQNPNHWQWAKLLDAGKEDSICFAYRRDRIAVAFPRIGVKVWIWIKGQLFL